MTQVVLGVYFHNGENLGRPPWLVCLRKFCISFILKRFKRPYLNVFDRFSSMLPEQMLCGGGRYGGIRYLPIFLTVFL